MSSPGYRPAAWGSQPQLWSITCALPTATGEQGPQTTYYFDAVMRVDHRQEAVGSRHPVQVGPAIVDNVYLQPSHVSLEVEISDAVQSFAQGQYGGASSRSVSAYQTFRAIQAARVPIALATRLYSYTNMYLQVTGAVETNDTIARFKGTLTFEQIIPAQVSMSQVSDRPNMTDTTPEGAHGVEEPSSNTMMNVDGIINSLTPVNPQ